MDFSYADIDGATVRPLSTDELVLLLRVVSESAGDLAEYCDRVEHVEPTVGDPVVEVGMRLREGACWAAQAMRADLFDLYMFRLTQIERRHPVHPPMVRAHQRTWSGLQAFQVSHDEAFHPDVWGLPRVDQLRHYTLHVAKLAGAVSGMWDHEAPEWEVFAKTRLPDIAVFGVKLATLRNVRLPDEPVVG